MKDSGRQIRGGARAISKHTDGRMIYGFSYMYKYRIYIQYKYTQLLSCLLSCTFIAPPAGRGDHQPKMGLLATR